MATLSHSTRGSAFDASQVSQTSPACTEAELVEAMMAGHDHAWVEFHRRYIRLIYRCITKITGRFSAMVSQEDVREIYATLVLQLLSNDMHKLRSFDPERGSRLGTWIGMLAINATYDHLRLVRREPTRGTLSEAHCVRCDRPDPFAEVDRKQRERALAEMLRDFSDKDRQFVTLYFDQGLDAEEVATRMQISVKTVYSKKHKIRTRLERILQEASLAA